MSVGDGVTVGGFHVCDPVAETVPVPSGVIETPALLLAHADVSADEEMDELPDDDGDASDEYETLADALDEPLTRGDADGDIDPLTELLTGGDRVGDSERGGDALGVAV